ncbi:GOLPH3/VPS74 family protein [Streptomyces daliensis]
MHGIGSAGAYGDTTGAAFTLSEELLLLAIDPERGRPAVDQRYLRWGLAAATLIELEAMGKVTGERGRIVVTAGVRTGVPLLDDALSTLTQGKRDVRTKRWLDLYSRRAQQVTGDALAARGVLRSETRRALGLFPVTHYRVFATELRAQRLAAFRDWGVYGQGDHGSRALAALLKATKLARRLGVPRAVRKEMRPLVRASWQATAVRRKVAATQAGSGGGDGGGGGGCGGGCGGGG